MLNITSAERIDRTAVQQGRPFPFGGGWLIIAAHNNEAAAQCRRELFAAFRGVPNSKDEREMLDKALAKAVLLSWRDITVDGTPLPVSEVNALWLITEVTHVREFVEAFSKAEGAFSVKSVIEAVEALKKSSDGSLSTGATPAGSSS